MATFNYPRRGDNGEHAGSVQFEDDEDLGSFARFVMGEFAEGRGIWYRGRFDGKLNVTYIPPSATGVTFIFDGEPPAELDDFTTFNY